MKRALALTLVLTLLGLMGMTAATQNIGGQEEQVVITEQMLMGDPSAAEGLTVTQSVEYDQRIRWTTSYSPGKPGSEETEFLFSSDTLVDYYEQDSGGWYNGLSISAAPVYEQSYSNLEAGEVSESYRSVKVEQGQTLPEELLGINQAYHQLYTETENGASGSATIHLADYFDYYPLQFMMDVPGFDSWWDWSIEYDYMKYQAGEPRESRLAINEYFRIPVLESETLELTIEKQSDGDLWATGFGSTDSDSYQPWARADHTEDAVWFMVNNRSGSGEIMDFSLVPGGYGIYRLPIPQDLTEEEQHLPNAVPLGQVETVYPLEDETIVTNLQVSLDGTRLYLTTLEDGSYYFSVIDLADVHLLQKTELAPCTNESSYWNLETYLFEQEGLLVLQLLCTDSVGDVFVPMLPREDGTFAPAFIAKCADTWDFTEDYSSFANYTSKSFSWNGTELAVVERLGNGTLGQHTYCSLSVSIFDKTGLVYYSICDSTLGIPSYDQYDCALSYFQPLVIQWDSAH